MTNIIPQKDYSSIYAKEGFYIFSRPISEDIEEQKRKKHYKLLEQIFVFVTTEFIHRGEQAFKLAFQQQNEQDFKSRMEMKKKEELAEYKSMDDIASSFIKKYCNDAMITY